MRFHRLFSTAIFLFYFQFSVVAQQTDYSKIVNPFIGTGGHGHAFPGATSPFGMVQVSPDTRLDGWDGCSGYHFSDSVIYGFSHTHLSGTGCSDYGDVMLMPMMGEISFDKNIYSSHFSHANENAHAGYYAVKLDDDDIDVKLTTSVHAALHKYTFNKSGKVNFILDLLHRDKLIDGKIRIINDHTIEGFRRASAWAKDKRWYFRIEFEKSFIDSKLVSLDSMQTQAAFSFNVKKGESIQVKVSLSPVDYEGANKNMKMEIPVFSFDVLKQFTEANWNTELGKIQVKGGTNEQQIIFYTALYHTFIQPNTYSDIDGRYRGRDLNVHEADSFIYYSVFSLWDTFRAAHPLYNIVQRNRNLDFIKTFLKQYEYGGRLPVWELSSNETDCMIGFHSVSVIADAYAKGIRNFDSKLAIEAMKKSATWNHYGLPQFNKNNYLSADDEHESVSKTLEYAYDDWCIAQLSNDKKEFEQHSQGWKNLFDPQNGLMRARKNGGWYKPFDPFEVNNNYTEANAWQYSFFVPHEINSLIKFHGGEIAFEKKLDELFSVSSKTSGRDQADITGLIGQYAHGNEPSHHMAYLYNYVGKSSKTQDKTFQILTELYKNAPDGLAGNEDCGQMSAWYVMSAMGLYAVCPGSDEYQVTTPLFDEVTIRTDDNKFLIITAKHNQAKDHYIKQIILNHADKKFTTLHHAELFNSSKSMVTELEFILSEKPNDKNFSSGAEIKITAKPAIKLLIPTPVIETEKQTFTDSLLITIHSLQNNCKMFYAINDQKNKEYLSPFYIHSSSTISAFAMYLKDSSSFTKGSYHLKENNWSVSIKGNYSKQYSAGGDDAIIDGLHGDLNWRKGYWQGFWEKDFEAVIDFKNEKEIKKISATFLQDMRAWIFFPVKVEFYISDDGINFTSIGNIENVSISNNLKEEMELENKNLQIKNFELKLTQKVKGKHLKVRAVNYGTIPDWHPGAGGKAYIFIDEVEVK